MPMSSVSPNASASATSAEKIAAVGVPAEDHVAKPEVLLKCREKLVTTQIFTAHDPVGIEDPDLNVLDAAFGQKLSNFRRGFHGAKDNRALTCGGLTQKHRFVPGRWRRLGYPCMPIVSAPRLLLWNTFSTGMSSGSTRRARPGEKNAAR